MPPFSIHNELVLVIPADSRQMHIDIEAHDQDHEPILCRGQESGPQVANSAQARLYDDMSDIAILAECWSRRL